MTPSVAIGYVLCLFYIAGMLKSRADLLDTPCPIKSAAWAMRVIANTVSIRECVAEDAVDRLQRLPDDPRKLAEPLPQDFKVMSDLGASTPPDWCKPKGSE